MRRTIWILGSFVLLTPSLASAANYVVAPDGDDGNAGDAASPWATLQHAADMVKAGDTVTVEPGDYQGFNVFKSGTADAPITFSAKPGVNITSENAQTTLDGINIEDTDNLGVIQYVVVEGFSVAGMARAGIRTARSAHITIRKNKSDQNQQFGIFTGNADDVVIEDNECSNSVKYQGIYASNSADRAIIRRNVVWGNNWSGIQINAGSSAGDGIASNVLVEANVVFDNSKEDGSGINCDGVQDSRFQNNLLYENHSNGLSLYMIDAAEPSKNNVVVNNTIFVPSDGRWAINIQNASSGNHLYNNILWSAHAVRGAINLITPTGLPGFVSDHNLMIDRFTMDGGATVIQLAEWQSETGQDASSSVAEPNFVDPAGADYHVQAGSPAIDQGTSTEAPESDLEGVARPQGAAFDIGAYEFCPGGECQSGTGGSGAGGTGTGGNGAGGTGTGGGGTTTETGGGGSSDDTPGDCGCRTAGSEGAGAGGLSWIATGLAAAVLRRRRRR